MQIEITAEHFSQTICLDSLTHDMQSGSWHFTQVTAPVLDALPTCIVPGAQYRQEPSSLHNPHTSGHFCNGWE